MAPSLNLKEGLARKIAYFDRLPRDDDGTSQLGALSGILHVPLELQSAAG
jgi:hypothetical protein